MTEHQKAIIEKFQTNLMKIAELIQDQQLKHDFLLQSGFIIGLLYKFEMDAE